MFIYEDVAIRTMPKSYEAVFSDDEEFSVRINKSVIENLDIIPEEDELMLVVFLAKIEFIRTSGRMFNSGIFKEPEFKENLHRILKRFSIEDLLQKIAEVKWHEIKAFFIEGDDEAIFFGEASSDELPEMGEGFSEDY